jgi:acetyltransferase-like isoleucine patch superfamily enzyme
MARKNVLWRVLSQLRLMTRRAYYAARFSGQPIFVHPTAYVSRRAVLRTRGGGSITIGARCEIHDFSMLLTYGGLISIDSDSSVNPFTIIYGHGGTQIGHGVRIAAHSVIIPANHQRGDEDSPGFLKPLTMRGIKIGDHTWIGAGCTILDGVSIGRHAVVGAGSVVVRSVPDASTVVGSPARPLD